MKTTSLTFIALVDQSNKPILIYVPPKEAKNVDKVLKYNTFANIALDYFDSQLFQWTSIEKDKQIKSLFLVEGVSVYGMLIKPTGLKIVIGFDSISQDEDDTEVCETFARVKQIYVRVKSNPFVSISDTDNNDLVSKLEDRFNSEFSNEDSLTPAMDPQEVNL